MKKITMMGSALMVAFLCVLSAQGRHAHTYDLVDKLGHDFATLDLGMIYPGKCGDCFCPSDQIECNFRFVPTCPDDVFEG